MAEIRGSFGSLDEWTAWRVNLGDVSDIPRAIIEDVKSKGYVEPFTGIPRHAYQVTIKEPGPLHESISSHQLNARKRALLVQIMLELRARQWTKRHDLRILGAEALSRVAMILRGIYPLYWGTEYLPDDASRLKHFPVPHMDLQKIDCPGERFDVFTSGDVFEHIPRLDDALQEIYRILKPGGLLISSFPFDPARAETLVKASISDGGELVHHKKPEYHGNPVDKEGGSLVFQIPGWDLLPKLRSFGYEDAYFSFVASSHFGIASGVHGGVFILTATKAGAATLHQKRPRGVVVRTSLPKQLIALIALPRSGTTMLTSVFGVHSNCEAVYEPWNGRLVSGETESRLEEVARAENLPNLSGKILFVKETAAFEGSIPGLRWLYESTPFPVERRMLMLVRRPEHTFLSEIERRKEWWKDDVTLNAASFESWAEKSKAALHKILDFGLSSEGAALSLEDFAARPAELLNQLAQRFGFTVEPQQLEYERYVDKKRMRGDINVSKNPGKISLATAESRVEGLAAIEELVRNSPNSNWFTDFQALHESIRNSGGLVSIRDIPTAIVAPLMTISHSARKK